MQDVIAASVAKEQGFNSPLTNPFKSMIPKVGNYDILVIVEALRRRHARISLHLLGNTHLDEVRNGT